MCKACQAVTRAQPSFSIKFLEVQEHHPEDGMFNLNYISEVCYFQIYSHAQEGNGLGLMIITADICMHICFKF